MVALDTNFLIAALRRGTPEREKLLGWQMAGEDFHVSAVVWAEFLCGPLAAGDKIRARALFEAVEPVTSADAERAAGLFNAAGRRSRTLADCLIAATAMRCGSRVATVNVKDFQPFVASGLVLA